MLPVVAGEREDGGVDILVTRDELRACKGQVAALEARITAALDAKLPPVAACPMRKRRPKTETMKESIREGNLVPSDDISGGTKSPLGTARTMSAIGILAAVVIVVWMLLDFR